MVNNTWQINSTSTEGLYVGQESPIYQANLNGILTDGDRISMSATGFTGTGATYGYVEFVKAYTNDFTGATFSSAYNSLTPIFDKVVNYANITAYTTPGLTGSALTIPAGTTFSFKTLTGNINESFLHGKGFERSTMDPKV